MADKHGCLFVVSAPSGAGKTTLCKAVRGHFPDILYSVSFTTRKPRNGEREGVDYHFISEARFKGKIRKNRLAEWAKVHGNYYGTSAGFISEGLLAGKDILIDIDVKGTLKILKRYPGCVTIFIMPPTLDTLRHRLELRGTEKKAEIDRRLVNAEKEMAKKNIYRHIIVNDRLADAESELISIILKYRLNRHNKV